MSVGSYHRLKLGTKSKPKQSTFTHWYDMQMIYFKYLWIFMKTWEIREKWLKNKEGT